MTVTREQIQRLIRRDIGVLNKLESHLGCVVCRGPLVDGRCQRCQAGDVQEAGQ